MLRWKFAITAARRRDSTAHVSPATHREHCATKPSIEHQRGLWFKPSLILRSRDFDDFRRLQCDIGVSSGVFKLHRSAVRPIVICRIINSFRYLVGDLVIRSATHRKSNQGEDPVSCKHREFHIKPPSQQILFMQSFPGRLAASRKSSLRAARRKQTRGMALAAVSRRLSIRVRRKKRGSATAQEAPSGGGFARE